MWGGRASPPLPYEPLLDPQGEWDTLLGGEPPKGARAGSQGEPRPRAAARCGRARGQPGCRWRRWGRAARSEASRGWPEGPSGQSGCGDGCARSRQRRWQGLRQGPRQRPWPVGWQRTRQGLGLGQCECCLARQRCWVASQWRWLAWQWQCWLAWEGWRLVCPQWTCSACGIRQRQCWQEVSACSCPAGSRPKGEGSGRGRGLLGLQESLPHWLGSSPVGQGPAAPGSRGCRGRCCGQGPAAPMQGPGGPQEAPGGR